MPEPADGGELIETLPLTSDDTPESWSGTYELASDAFSGQWELSADGTGTFTFAAEVLLEGSWWYQAKRRALTLPVDVGLAVTFVLPEGWNGDPVCVGAAPDNGVPTCFSTFGRLPEKS